MTLDGLFCADVPWRNCSLTHTQQVSKLYATSP